MRGLAARCCAGIQNARCLPQLQALQQQGRSQLRRAVLHRHQALRKTGQALHRQGLGQLHAMLAPRLGGDVLRLQLL